MGSSVSSQSPSHKARKLRARTPQQLQGQQLLIDLQNVAEVSWLHG